MNKIKEIIITSVKLMGFKIFEGPEGFNLARTSYIYGGNGQGKTSIADAIAYAFCGTSFWGEKTTDRLINNKSKEMVVQVDFVDDNGELHTLIRRRKGNTTDITFDSHPYKQADLATVFADKDIFLSALNPLYFIEKIAKDGREFLQKLLPPVPHESVIAAMSDGCRKALENESIPDPAYYIKLKKEKLKELSEEMIERGGM
ncbi:MAG: AAA family ATPase, partial [Clostridia bacterium]|nr:AAA family ATPase [Clostridia bacterium]